MSEVSLEQRYQATTYWVELDRGRIGLRIGEPNAQLDALLSAVQCTRWALVSAVNPRSRKASHQENLERHGALLEWVERMSLRAYPSSAEADQLDWEPEGGMLILDMREDIATSLAQSFGQYAILSGEIGQPVRLVWCVAP